MSAKDKLAAELSKITWGDPDEYSIPDEQREQWDEDAGDWACLRDELLEGDLKTDEGSWSPYVEPRATILRHMWDLESDWGSDDLTNRVRAVLTLHGVAVVVQS